MTEDKIKDLEFILRRVQKILKNEGNFNIDLLAVLKNDLQSIIDLVIEKEKSDERKNPTSLDSTSN